MFNKSLFSVFKGGEALQSPSLTKSSTVKTKAQAQIIRLEAFVEPDPPDPAVEVVDQTKKNNCIAALENVGDGADVLSGHIQAGLSSFIEDMSMAATVKSIDAYANDVPESCANINTIAGTLNGAADAMLSETEQIIDELDQGITDYNADVMPLEDFHDLLDRVTAELGTSVAGIVGMVQNEVEKLDELREAHRAFGRALTCQTLIDDDCVRPLLYKLSGPTLADILTDEFNVVDAIEATT